MTRRMTEIEQQAAVLVSREQELDRQEREMRDTLRKHSDERTALFNRKSAACCGNCAAPRPWRPDAAASLTSFGGAGRSGGFHGAGGSDRGLGRILTFGRLSGRRVGDGDSLLELLLSEIRFVGPTQVLDLLGGDLLPSHVVVQMPGRGLGSALVDLPQAQHLAKLLRRRPAGERSMGLIS